MAKTQYGLGKGLGALLGGEDLSELRKPVGYINKAVVSAQEKPKDYQDLVVRIAGYSAYFVELSTELQNDLIGRTELSFD